MKIWKYKKRILSKSKKILAIPMILHALNPWPYMRATSLSAAGFGR